MPTHSHPQIARESFQLSGLAAENKLTNPTGLADFQRKTGLSDFYWEVLYDKSRWTQPNMETALAEAEGYIFFIHGWDASHQIWEDLPLRLLLQKGRLVCFSPDVNGFGRSPFLKDTPTAKDCCPSALMLALELWMSTIGLWPVKNRPWKPFYLFVGHSMGGAALFYKAEQGWKNEAYGLYALAPALLCNDVQLKTFYKTLGFGIGLPSFSFLKKRLAPQVIEVLGGGASNLVKNEHIRIFNDTPFGTLAQTIYAMGAMATLPQRDDWSNLRIALGNKDKLVNLTSMLELVEQFDIHADQLRVALGDHYFFSHGSQSPHSHRHNREVVLNDLLTFCKQLETDV
ncbi:alpha/beta hydrolase [Anaerolineales bacterium HSG25]|nr:alpha/beta hydrolase [Anaerolineales bacterium HSG25]